MLITATTEHAPFYLDTKLWVAIPIVLFLALLIRKGLIDMINKALDERAENIKNELDEARHLREEAQTLLASYHRKQKEAQVQAQEIIEQARLSAENMAAKARKDLAERLERRAVQAEAKIANAEAQALTDVKNRAADLAISTSDRLIRKHMTAADHNRFIKDGISQMEKRL